MKVYLATDHAGFELKEQVKKYLQGLGYEVEDCGAFSLDKEDDYPDFIAKAAEAVSNDQSSRAVIFGGSGQGEAIVANKFPGVRAALFYGPRLPVGATDVSGNKSNDPYEMLKLTREHNNTNVLSIGVRFVTEEEALHAIKLWLESPYSGGERHQRRIDKISKIEEKEEE